MKRRILALTLLAAGCVSGRREEAPVPAATTAPVLVGQVVMVFPLQRGLVPVSDTAAQHFAVDADAVNAELAYWLPELAGNVRWVLPATIHRAVSRSPTLGVDINNLEVSAFQRAQVKRVGDPLFGDLRKLASVLDARIAVIPVASQAIGKTPEDAKVQIATAVLDAMSGTVIWFGLHEATEPGSAPAGIASAAQVFARAFAGKQR